MNPYIESAVFHNQIAMALMGWADVEFHLYEFIRIYIHSDKQAEFGDQFFGHGAFKSKLKHANLTAETNIKDKKILKRWGEIAQELHRLSILRNNLAHFQHIHFGDHQPGYKYMLINWKNFMTFPYHGGPGKDGLDITKIVEMKNEFYAMRNKLSNSTMLVSVGEPEFLLDESIMPTPPIEEIFNEFERAYIAPYILEPHMKEHRFIKMDLKS